MKRIPDKDRERILAEIESHSFMREEASMNSSYATPSSSSLGRKIPEVPEAGEHRSPFSIDRDRILYSKAFFRLAGKTQVFMSPKSPLVSNRMTHTMHVAHLARSISRSLGLNEDLAEAIGLGHDIGHPPFGHRGEKVLDELCKEHGGNGFEHNVQSARVLETLEKGGEGLNLSWEVLDGIVSHCGETQEGEFRPDEIVMGDGHGNCGNDSLIDGKPGAISPATLEGCVVKMCDRIAYVRKDIEDAAKAGIINEDDIPLEITEVLGSTNGRIINTLVKDIIVNFQWDRERFKKENGREPARHEISIKLSWPVLEALNALIHDFNYPKIYLNPENLKYEEQTEGILRRMFETFMMELEGLEMPKAIQASLFDFHREGEENGMMEITSSGNHTTLAMVEREMAKKESEGLRKAKLTIIRENIKSSEGRISSILPFLAEMKDDYIINSTMVEMVRDHMALMTDNMAMNVFEEMAIPRPLV